MNTARPAPVRDPRWVWIGRRIRYNAKTVSVLAIAETIAASILALYATFHWGATRWFALYLAVSPLLLLKTKQSVRWGLLWWDGVWDEMQSVLSVGFSRVSDWARFLLITPLLGLLAIAAVPIKLAATLNGLFLNPRVSVSRLTKNWWEQCLQKDMTALPELLPGATRGIQGKWGEYGLASLEAVLEEIRDPYEEGWAKLFMWLALLPFAAAIIVFGLGYRWCLKATSAFWVLLLFFSRPLRRKKDTLEWRTGDLLEHTWNKVTRLWGLAVIVMHGVLPLVLWQGYGALITKLKELEPQMQHLVRFFLAEHGWGDGFPLSAWHVAGALSALLTWGLWWLAHDSRIALKHGHIPPAEQEKKRRIIVGLMWVRALLVSYTVFCGLVAIFRTLNWTMPRVDWLP